jgi:hypothetical protein
MGERAITIVLTLVEVNHLVSLLVDAEREGSYYGPREQYWRRHARIQSKLLSAAGDTEQSVDNASVSDPGTSVPPQDSK